MALGVATGALGGYIAEKKGRTQALGLYWLPFGLIGGIGLVECPRPKIINPLTDQIYN